ncbi:hypothetical protein EYF80_006428 [Liparis tanakae]|uniref:Uncharacterized protein n=1 Tax=Liparis tanakae TaxID=230148 RepID=A0A4Z2J0A5_9TELE|nr:hypothetical protein EYF80_006428 [Liparis tanakae]
MKTAPGHSSVTQRAPYPMVVWVSTENRNAATKVLTCVTQGMKLSSPPGWSMSPCRRPMTQNAKPNVSQDTTNTRPKSRNMYRQRMSTHVVKMTQSCGGGPFPHSCLRGARPAGLHTISPAHTKLTRLTGRVTAPPQNGVSTGNESVYARRPSGELDIFQFADVMMGFILALLAQPGVLQAFLSVLSRQRLELLLHRPDLLPAKQKCVTKMERRHLRPMLLLQAGSSRGELHLKVCNINRRGLEPLSASLYDVQCDVKPTDQHPAAALRLLGEALALLGLTVEKQTEVLSTGSAASELGAKVRVLASHVTLVLLQSLHDIP